jgi:catechol 2,3-dioxygenase-like lactoylglutathione lyase family enzyme
MIVPVGDVIRATPHHIGCAVKRLEDGRATYGGALGLKRRTRVFDITSQHVRICFVELADRFYLEFVSPLDDRARLGRFLQVGFYHLCFLVDDLAKAREQLTTEKFVALPAFESEAFAENLCQFFLSPQDHLIELAQMPAHDFATYFSANLEEEAGA